MIAFHRLIIPLLFSSALFADADSSAVNERIFVPKAELEAHWKVNCTGSWAGLVALLGETSVEACAISPHLHRELRLCSFIYQSPGEESAHKCPDYRGATGILDSNAGDKACTALIMYLQQQTSCGPGA